MEDLSCLLSDILDCICYSQEIINVRRNFWKQLPHLPYIKFKDTTMIIAGSKAEGITSFFESDIDCMHLLHDVICADDIQHLPPLPDKTVLHADTSEAPPGYTRLRLISCNGASLRSFFRESAYETETEDVYLSSTLFVSKCRHEVQSGDTFTYDDLSGPAVPGHDKYLKFDHVIAISCYHSSLLQTWKSRRRLYNWPPENIREAAATELLQVVPVGSKRSCDQWQEWRFCFITPELKLTFSLNETQIKLYILLKMVAKDILKNVCKEMSSYIMKNVTFWISELLPDEIFKKDNLLSLLFLALRFLKSAISHWNWLPYYMIPGRNLLAERLSYDSRRQLSDLIETLIAEGPRFILRCNKLRIAFSVTFSSPALLVDFRSRRNMIEILHYIAFILKKYKADIYIISQVVTKGFDLILPEWRTLLLSGIPAESVDFLLKQRFLSILS